MDNSPKQIKVIVENTFATSGKNSQELNITVYERAFRKLVHEKSRIGKIFPIYIKIEDSYRVLGIFTLNNLGSTSFFPELPEGTFFDHITFGKSLSKINAHLTHIIEGGRKKLSGLAVNPLTNGTQHIITLIFQDLDLLKLAPNEVIYPIVDIEQQKLLQDALFTRGGYNGSGTLETYGNEGPIVIQIFIIPKGIDYKNMQFTKVGLSNQSEHFNEEKLNGVRFHTACLKHEFQDEYQFGLLAFRYPEKINAPAYLGYGIDKSQFFFNSTDEELNTSVNEMARKALKKKT